MANTKELQKYNTEYDEAKKNFMYYFKPEFDRGYKLFSSWNGDRAVELEQTTDGEVWQSNVFIPQVFAYIKTFLQKTVGITPDFKLEGKNSEAVKDLILWLWEIGMSDDLIDYFLQVFICGTTIGKDFLKKETKKKRQKEIGMIDKIKKLIFKTATEKITFRPDFDPVDIYNFYPHPRMKKMSDPFPVFHRYVLTLDEMKAQYPDVPANTWNQFVDKDGEVIKSGGDTTDYAYVRKEVLIQVRKSLRETTKASTPIQGNPNNPVQLPVSSDKLFEVVERWTDGHLCVFLPMEGTPIEINANAIKRRPECSSTSRGVAMTIMTPISQTNAHTPTRREAIPKKRSRATIPSLRPITSGTKISVRIGKRCTTKELFISSINSDGAKNAVKELAKNITPRPKRIKKL